MLSGMGWVAERVEKLGDVGLLLVGLGVVTARLYVGFLGEGDFLVGG